MLKQMQYDEQSHTWSGLLYGELDAVQAPKLLSSMQELLDGQVGNLHLDCRELEFVDSMGLGALVKLRKAVEEKGHAIRLTNVKKRIYKLFVITGLDSSFGIEVKG